MAVLGFDGRVTLRRDAPDPVLVLASSVNSVKDTIAVSDQSFWTGDEVYLYSPNGLPISTDAAPDGVGVYFGSTWDLGQNRSHISSESDQFYNVSDSVYFYNRGEVVNSGTYFIYRDLFDRISLYESRQDSINGDAGARIDLLRLDFGYLVIAASGTQEYDNAVAECVDWIGTYKAADVKDEVSLRSICDFAPDYLLPEAGVAEYDNADLQPRRWINGFPWFIQGSIREWSLDLDGASIDSTAVGQKFGENVKSVITGGGSFDFLVERYGSEDAYDPTVLMKLLFLTEKGAKTEARFYMADGTKAEKSCAVDGRTALTDQFYYECSILITNIAINTRVDELIAGSAQFVTTGQISLKIGT